MDHATGTLAPQQDAPKLWLWKATSVQMELMWEAIIEANLDNTFEFRRANVFQSFLEKAECFTQAFLRYGIIPYLEIMSFPIE